MSHRDGMGPDPGAFYKLETLQMGDEVIVSTSEYTVRYIISNNFMINKSDFPKIANDIFKTDGSPRLVMITCGGKFDFDTMSYKKNVIAIAKPLTIQIHIE